MAQKDVPIAVAVCYPETTAEQIVTISDRRDFAATGVDISRIQAVNWRTLLQRERPWTLAAI